jgi:hypothetical protein
MTEQNQVIKTIKIHEFSTGIKLVWENDQWVSGGFDSDYLNCTLPSIPSAVQNSISSGEFKLGEATATDKPAIIGREVIGINKAWSVMAVVTKGTDNKGGRSPQLFRFFLSEGRGNLGYIFRWWQKNKQPSYDPTQVKNIGDFAKYIVTKNIEDSEDSLRRLPDEVLTLNNEDSSKKQGGLQNFTEYLQDDCKMPIILDSSNQNITSLILNAIAYVKLEQMGQLNEPIAWAYNVKALAKIGRFQVIYPCSKEAEENLQKEKENLQAFEQRQLLIGESEINKTLTKKIKTAGSLQLQKLDIKLILDAVYNQSMDKDFWEQKFTNELKIDDVKNRKTFAGDEVRLVWAQPFFLPSTLPDASRWIMQRKFNSEPYHIVEELNQVIKDLIVNIKNSNDIFYKHKLEKFYKNIRQAILYLVIALLEEKPPNLFSKIGNLRPQSMRNPTFLQVTLWLLKDTNGIWGDVFFRFQDDGKNFLDILDEDFEQVVKNKKEITEKIQQDYSFSKLPEDSSTVQHELESKFDSSLESKFDSSIENTIVLSDPSWKDNKSIKKTIQFIFLKTNAKFKEETLPFLVFAKFFEKISINENNKSQSGSRVSALFYHLSKGKVPTSVWKECRFTADNNNPQQHPPDENAETKDNLKELLLIPIGWNNYEFVINFCLRKIAGKNLQNSKVLSYNGLLDQTTLYGIPIEREIGLGEKTVRLIGTLYFLIVGLLTKKREVPAFGLILVLAILLTAVLTSKATSWKMTHKDINPISFLMGKIINLPQVTCHIPVISRICEPPKPDPKPDLFEELYKIPKDFKKYLRVDAKDSQDAIIQILQESGSSEVTLTLTWNTDKEQWNKNEPQWKTAIRAYQQKIKDAKPDLNVEVNGLLRKDDDTDKRLRCEIIEKLQADKKSITGVAENKVKECAEKYGVQKITATDKTGSPGNNGGTSIPSKSPTATDWNATVEAIDALRDEFVNMGQDKSTVEPAIIKNIAAGFGYAYKADNQDDWTPKIKKFQKENSIIETGSISQNDETYKALKCEVAKELELTDKVPDCPAHSN